MAYMTVVSPIDPLPILSCPHMSRFYFSAAFACRNASRSNRLSSGSVITVGTSSALPLQTKQHASLPGSCSEEMVRTSSISFLLRRCGLLPPLGLGLLDQRFFVLVFPLDLSALGLGIQGRLVPDTVDKACNQSRVAQNLERRENRTALATSRAKSRRKATGSTLTLTPCEAILDRRRLGNEEGETR